jgi:guanosine-3',5'-bis(diphosphate) 3'-pyrophosphohydrolase
MRVEQAIELASRFHEGAVDKAGRPYIGHILRVVDAVNTHEENLAAAMHDLLEDTPLTRRHLSCAGSPPDTTLAVEALARTRMSWTLDR